MIKRLLLSFAVISATAASLTFGAFAYFKDTAAGPVTITAGNSDLQLAWDDDCNGTPEASGLDNFAISWSDIVPGDQELDCVTVTNTGDGALDIYVHTAGFGGSGALQSFFQALIEDISSNDICGWASPNHAVFTSANGGRGCKLADELAEGASVTFRLNSRFVDSGSDQSALEGAPYNFNLTVDGYTD